jgi:hypothetical protein
VTILSADDGPVWNGAAGDHDAHGAAAAHQLFDGLTHLGALVLIGHLIQAVQQENPISPVHRLPQRAHGRGFP